jgi:hypothetical protein
MMAKNQQLGRAKVTLRAAGVEKCLVDARESGAAVASVKVVLPLEAKDVPLNATATTTLVIQLAGRA